MQELVTSFIIQSKECRLKGIGRFQRVTHAAQTDIANKLITPPFEERTFREREERVSDELIRYVANKKSISTEDALEQLKEWCADTKSKLKGGEEVILESLGALKANQAGNISFRALEATLFFGPVAVERVVHKNSTHHVLVGDKETNSSAMNEFFKDEKEPGDLKNNSWKVVSIVLGAIALILLIFYFYNHSFSISGIGNQEKVVPQTPAATYSPK